MTDFDATLFTAINGLAGTSALLDDLMRILGRPGSLWVPGLLAGGYWVWANRREALIGLPTLLTLIIVADAFGARLKDLVARPRPCQVLQGVHEVIGCGKTFSFPSNHALNTAAAAAFFHLLYPRSGWVTWPIVALIGLSRVYVGGHYVTDVAGGWVAGALLGAVAAALLLRWRRFRPAAMRE
jgi:undecaprenyl-diphosphatase